jgi:hypothetical protein
MEVNSSIEVKFKKPKIAAESLPVWQLFMPLPLAAILIIISWLIQIKFWN